MTARQILVLGVHRSGTSLLTETAVRLGLHAGEPEDFDSGDRWNAKGYWEHRRIRGIDEALLSAADSTWFRGTEFDPHLLPGDELARLTREAQGVISALDEKRPWVAKDPRFCVVLPFWLPLLSSPGFLFALLGPLSVARSLRVRDGYPIPVGVALWEVQLLAALEATRRLPRVAFWYEDLVASPEAEVGRLARWLGENAGLEAAAVERALATDSQLRHHLTDPEEEARRLPPGARHLLGALRTGEAFEDSFDATSSEDARELVAFIESADRTRRGLERGWKEQRAAHGESIEVYEEMIRRKDEYIADLQRHLASRSE